MCAGACVYWFSRTQKCVTLSTSEAEYVALGDAVKELLFLRQVWRFMIPGYERDLGVTHDWNSALRTGNPVRSYLVTHTWPS